MDKMPDNLNKTEFIKEFILLYSQLSKEELAAFVWRYSNNLYLDGYEQGKNNPDFD